ncbi:MAG: class II aldolase/adducin family protein [Oscillospiraceae bacterium]|nr:class II aldolase/adducin family protein [Oscillospiraceae bacterium]
MNVEECKREIITAGLSAYSCGLVSAAGGNISMRLGDRYFITATNAPLRALKPEDVVEIDLNGNLLGEDYGGRRPSKEARLHMAIYKNRPDIDSVIHVHPVYSIACTIAFPNDFPILTVSAINKIGKVGYIPFAGAGSDELVSGAERAIRENDLSVKTLLMERHGILVYDQGMEKCYERTELVEETAKIAIFSAIAKAAAGK